MLEYLIAKGLRQAADAQAHRDRGRPAQVTPVEKRAVVQAAKSAGAKQAYPIEEPLAAAIGAGLPISTPAGI